MKLDWSSLYDLLDSSRDAISEVSIWIPWYWSPADSSPERDSLDGRDSCWWDGDSSQYPLCNALWYNVWWVPEHVHRLEWSIICTGSSSPPSCQLHVLYNTFGTSVWIFSRGGSWRHSRIRYRVANSLSVSNTVFFIYCLNCSISHPISTLQYFVPL